MAAFIHVRSQNIILQDLQVTVKIITSYIASAKKMYNALGNIFLGHNEETRGGSLSSKTRMQIFLRFLSDPESQRGFVKEEGAHRLTINKIITNVLP
jgi:hypothetical protein